MNKGNTASIDIGTNTTRLLIGEITEEFRINKLYREQKITRLGDGLSANDGVITSEAIERTIDALRGFSISCRRFAVNSVKAVATSAARSSINGHELVEKIKQETGIEAEIISGDREAFLTIKGILDSLESRDISTYILDIGGGSTEIAIVVEGDIKKIISFEIGVLHLLREHMPSELPGDSELAGLKERVYSTIWNDLNILGKEYSVQNPGFIATSGTPLTLACIFSGLDRYDTAMIDGVNLSKQQIREFLGEIRCYTPEERLQKYGAIEKGREEILIPGCMILLSFLDVLDIGNIRVTENSLLEGLMLDN